MVADAETNIWHRLIEPCWDHLSPDAAQAILQLKFGQQDMDRMNHLAEIARNGTLTPNESLELETYMRIGRMVAILQAKARIALDSPLAR